MTIVSVFLSATVSPYAPHTSTTAVIIFARLAGDLDTIATSSWMSAGSHLRLSQPSSRTDAHEIGFNLGVCSESLLGSIENRCEEDVEQYRRKNTPLAKALADLKPFRHSSPIQSYARSHPIVELAHDIDHHRRHPQIAREQPREGTDSNSLDRGTSSSQHDHGRNWLCDR